VRVEASVVIDRPLADVWQYLAEPSNTPQYWKHMVAYEVTSPPPVREGTTMTGTWRIGPLRSELNQVVTRDVENEIMEWKDTNDHLPNVQSFSFSEVDGATRVIYRQVGEPQDRVGRALAPVMQVVIQRDAWTSLDRLKEILEGEAATT
jgi:uncharacterized membrane protein